MGQSRLNNKGQQKASSRPDKAELPRRALGNQTKASAPLGILDSQSRREIVAVLCALVAIVMFLSVATSSSALASHYISEGLHLGFGFGSLILPLMLVVLSVSFFISFEKPFVRERLSLGLALLLLCICTLASLFVPGAGIKPDVVFTYENLVTHGGYVGSGFAWAGLTLFGQVISVVIVVGIMIVALIIEGLSIAQLVERIKDRIRPSVVGDPKLINPDDIDPSAIHYVGRKQSLKDRLTSALFGRRRHSQDAQDKTGPLYAGRTAIMRPGSNGVAPGVPQVDMAEKPEVKSAIAAGLTRKLGDVTPAASEAFADKTKQATQALAEGKDPRELTRKLGEKKRSDVTTSDLSLDAAAQTITIKAASSVSDSNFSLPPADMLKVTPQLGRNVEAEEVLAQTAQDLQQTLEDFGVFAQVVGWVAGPTVTLFKIELPAGVRVSKIENLEKDIALALASQGVRIFAPIPGTNYVGIEVPNKIRETVLLGDIIPAATKGPLQMAVGKDVEGKCIISDLASMPHLLIAGTTGSGKSVSINAMIMSILMRATPNEVRFIMIDPKRVEFTPYNGIPHLYVPVVNEDKEAASALAWCVAEMERRLKVFAKVSARNINQYNAKVKEGLMIGEEPADHLPYIVVIIDELADLMMNVGKDVETYIARLAQLARAAGIHLIVATQRPSTNVVTGLIKSNITNRISFNVASGIDSRVILDQTGAENLIGLGDLLFNRPDLGKPIRIQGCYVGEDEINSVVEFLKAQGEPEYHAEILKTHVMGLGDTAPDAGGGFGADADPLLWEAADIVVNSQMGSTSNLQRRLSVGYSRAGRIMDMLEERGIVGPANGSKPREVLVDMIELESLKAFEQND